MRKGQQHTSETKALIKAKRALQVMLPVSDATRKLMSIKRKERKMTAHTEEWKLAASKRLKGHRGWNKGKSQSLEARRKNSLSQLELFKTGKRTQASSGIGKRSYYQSPLQGQVCFRSSYELAYAKYLDSLHELWMYEMETFDLGNTSYTPDFFLPRLEKFIEIKGYMLPKAQEKINQFREQYTWDLEILGLQELKELGIVR